MKNLLLCVVFLISVKNSTSQVLCEDAIQVCLTTGHSSILFNTGEFAEAGNDYGCMFTQPNPNWFYVQISESGNIEMELYGENDIDFVMWGPFPNYEAMFESCGTLGDMDSPIVDCSYSPTASETPEITGAEVGEFYLILITNYAAIDQSFDLSQIAGTGEVSCEEIPSTGTYTTAINGEPAMGDTLFLCLNDELTVVSNDDYILPDEIIEVPLGDGIYTAQLAWLVYDSVPATYNPESDPHYLDYLIPQEDFMTSNNEADAIISTFGRGTYYFVPITLDDGVGDGLDNDNFTVYWDTDGSNNYQKGTPLIVTYSSGEATLIGENQFCLSAEDELLEIVPAGGELTGTGIIDENLFSPEIAGLGEHVLNYSFSVDGCGLITDTIIVDVYQPIINFSLDDTYCQDAAPIILEALPAGGDFTGAGVEDGSFFIEVVGLGTHEITYSYTDGLGCSNSAIQVVDVLDCFTSLSTEKSIAIQVYPNPFNDFFTVNVPTALGDSVVLNVINVIGQTVYQSTSKTATSVIINTHNLPTGIYFLTVSDKDGQLLETVKLLRVAY